MAIEIVDFPIKNGGSFHGKMLVHQRVSLTSEISLFWQHGDVKAGSVRTQGGKKDPVFFFFRGPTGW